MAVGKIKVPGDIFDSSLEYSSQNGYDSVTYTYGHDDNNNLVSIKVVDGRVFTGDNMYSDKYSGTEIFDFETAPSSTTQKAQSSASTSSIKNVDFSHALEVCQSAGQGRSFSDSLNGTDIATINSMIKNKVNEAGYGTRDAVVAAALALTSDFSEKTKNRFYYTSPGSDTHNGMAQQEGISENTNLDCRAFIQWVVHNAGFDASGLEYMGHLNQAVGTLPGVTERSNIRQVQPGDIISTDYVNGRANHTWLVIGVTEDGYYSAEEYSGAGIKFYSFDEPFGEYDYPDTTIYNMQDYYNNSSNVR